MPELVTESIHKLEFDNRNPRLVEMYDNDNDAAESKIEIITSHHKTIDIVQDIIDGYYVAPEPMLGLIENDGITVVDGNRRLAALAITHDSDLWSIVSKRSLVKDAKSPEGRIEHKVDVLLYDSWDEIHKIKIRKHRTNGSLWGGLAQSYDMRRMLLEGKTCEDVRDIYNVSRFWHNTRIMEMVNAINVFDQINSFVECPWFKTFHFKSLNSALNHDLSLIHI